MPCSRLRKRSGAGASTGRETRKLSRRLLETARLSGASCDMHICTSLMLHAAVVASKPCPHMCKACDGRWLGFAANSLCNSSTHIQHQLQHDCVNVEFWG